MLVDFHAEATSEKVGMARWLDGRVTAVFGSHTHVQTNDARVLAGGTAAISDAGMTGPHDSVIGVRAELAIERMRTGMHVRFEPAEGDVRIEGALVECDSNGRATSCAQVPEQELSVGPNDRSTASSTGDANHRRLERRRFLLAGRRSASSVANRPTRTMSRRKTKALGKTSKPSA